MGVVVVVCGGGVRWYCGGGSEVGRRAVAGVENMCRLLCCESLPRPAPTAPPPQVLDFGLNHANSAVVMATAKLFLHYTLAPAFAAQHRQVLESLKDPLQTLVQGREPEVVYGVLANVRVLARRYPAAFSQLYPEVRVCACVWTVGFWGGGVRGGILVVGRCSQLWCKVYWGGRGEGFGLVGRSPC